MIMISVVVFMRGRLLQRLGAVHTHSTDPTIRPFNFAAIRRKRKAEHAGLPLRFAREGGIHQVRDFFKSLAVLLPKTTPARACVLMLVFLLIPGRANAQAIDKLPSPKEPYDRIAALDSALFAAYNKCDIDKVGAFFAGDLEFYHEKGGLTLTRDATLALMRKNLCGADSNRVRRELVEGSMEVRPINNYGAVQTGEHRFYLTQKGQQEKLDGIGKFVMLWREKDGE